MHARRHSGALLAAAALAGCRGARPAATPAPAPHYLALSSAASDYSPEVRALLRVGADGDSLRLEVDSGAVTAPGRSSAPPAASHLGTTAPAPPAAELGR
jgi:hypothetical protein